MTLKCAGGHTWEYLPNFPDTKPCPECGATGGAEIGGRHHGGFKPPKNYDLELSDPETLQFWMDNKKHLEDIHLSGDRYAEVHDVVEAGPMALRPFGGDTQARKDAERERGYSKWGNY